MTEKVDQWLKIARTDLKVSRNLLQLNDRDYDRTICFHTQQSAEKYLKALLVFHQVSVPKTHDLPRLREMVSTFLNIPVTLESLLTLSLGAVDSRYPSKDPDLDMVKICIETAEIIQTTVLQYLADKGVRHADDL